MIEHPYNISNERGFEYYTDVQLVKKDLMEYIRSKDSDCFKLYVNFMSSREKDRIHSCGEYLLDMLLFGVLWRVYGELSINASNRVLVFLEILWWVRRKLPVFKGSADSVRALLLNRYFVKKTCHDIPFSDEGIDKLYKWLKATGEFREEARRISAWRAFLSGLNQQKRTSCYDYLQKLTGFFVKSSEIRLMKYTSGVERFRMKRLTIDEIREDVLLCTRPEILYYLNMVGSELMNEGLRQGYELTDKKIVLLPGCMRLYGGKNCKAQKSGNDLLCINCQKQCVIGQITEMGKTNGFTTAIVVHSSNFSDTINRWAGEKSTGVVASACLLHLLMGGYEMERAGINAQCVPLNFSGCARHWHQSGIPTELNIDRLIELIHQNKKMDRQQDYPCGSKNVDFEWAVNDVVCHSRSGLDFCNGQTVTRCI